MTLGAFLSDRLGRLILQGVFAAVAAVFLLATGTAPGVLLLLLFVWLFLFVLVQALDFLKCRTQLHELEAIMDGLDKKYLFAQCVPKPRSAYQRKLLWLLRRSEKAMLEEVSNAQSSQKEYREYIERWVHEIKTPITAAQLICRGTDGETRRKLSRELAQIDNHVERALFYARAENPEKDFIVRQVNLAEIVTQAIQHHQTLLLQSGVGIEARELDCMVYTDDKWAAFMLGQLLQNAVRYRSEAPAITLSACQLGGRVQLVVQDNGIGIPAHELSRVFQRGFTGSNGRARGGSTGIGLYLCHRLAGFLEIDLGLQSDEGRGTTVLLTFPAKENLSKV